MLIYSIKLPAQVCYETGGLIINEVSQGTTGSQEYVELVVVANPNNPTAGVDLTGWIIDDNNQAAAGVGTAQGYLAFGACYNNVPPGSIIVIYNANDPNPSVPANDPLDANNNGVYIIPHNDATCMAGCNSNPSTTSSSYCPCENGLGPPPDGWQIGYRNAGDRVNLLDPGENFVHNFTYGDVNDAAEDFHFDGNGGGQVYFFDNSTSDDWQDFSNWTEISVSGNQTPGAPNNTDNADFINNIATSTTAMATLCDSEIPQFCASDGGDLVAPPSYINPVSICAGIDVAAFTNNFSASDEFDPGTGYTFTYILTQTDAINTIIDYNATGDFDTSVLPDGVYEVWILTTKNSGVGSISNPLTYVAGFNDIETLQLDEIECGKCIDLDNTDNTGTAMQIIIGSPISSAIYPSEVCEGVPFTIDLTTSPDSDNFSWSPNGATTEDISVAGISTSTTYTVTFDGGGCTGYTESFTINVNPACSATCPENFVVSSNEDDNNVCVGDVVDLDFSGDDLPATGTVEWYLNNGIQADPTVGTLVGTATIPPSNVSSTPPQPFTVTWDFEDCIDNSFNGTGVFSPALVAPSGTNPSANEVIDGPGVNENGDGCASGNGGEAFNLTNFNSSFDSNDYFEFTINTGTCYNFEITELDFQVERSNTISNLAVRSSSDGFAADLFTGTIPNNAWQSYTVPFAPTINTNSSSNETFRIYAWGGSNSNTLRIDNVVISGIATLDATCDESTTYSGAVPTVNYTITQADCDANLTTFQAVITPFSSTCPDISPDELDNVTDGIDITISCPEIELVSAENISCNGANDGEIEVNVSNAIAPITYNWTPSALGNTNNPTGLSAGTYNLSITDDAGCTVNLAEPVVITEPNILDLSVTLVVDSCGLSTGEIIVAATGGTQEFAYSLNNGTLQASPEFTGLSAGIYSVQVQDENNCTDEELSISVGTYDNCCDGPVLFIKN